MNLEDAIWAIVKDNVVVSCITAEVKSVDKDNDTCDLKSLDDKDDLEWFDVRLNATIKTKETKIIAYPEIGSLVLVMPINNQKSQNYIVAMSEIDNVVMKMDKLELDASSILLNGGDNGGLIVIADLITKINRIENTYNALVTDYKAHVHPVPSALPLTPGVPVVTTPAVTAATPITPITLKSDLENKDVKH